MRLTGTARVPIPIGHLELIRGRVDLLGKRFLLLQQFLVRAHVRRFMVD